MDLLVEADQPGNQLDDYVTRLNAILSQKAAGIRQLQARLAQFQKRLKDHNVLVSSAYWEEVNQIFPYTYSGILAQYCRISIQIDFLGYDFSGREQFLFHWVSCIWNGLLNESSPHKFALICSKP